MTAILSNVYVRASVVIAVLAIVITAAWKQVYVVVDLPLFTSNRSQQEVFEFFKNPLVYERLHPLVSKVIVTSNRSEPGGHEFIEYSDQLALPLVGKIWVDVQQWTNQKTRELEAEGDIWFCWTRVTLVRKVQAAQKPESSSPGSTVDSQPERTDMTSHRTEMTSHRTEMTSHLEVTAPAVLLLGVKAAARHEHMQILQRAASELNDT